MWRLTITQREQKKSSADDKFYRLTNEIKFESDSLCVLLDAVSTLSSIQDNDTNYTIDKVVKDEELQ